MGNPFASLRECYGNPMHVDMLQLGKSLAGIEAQLVHVRRKIKAAGIDRVGWNNAFRILSRAS